MAFNANSLEDEDIVSEINITPLTDVFLVLLIIFMISSSAMLEGGFQVKLPTAKQSSLTGSDNSKPVYVTVGSSGQLAVNNQTVSERDLMVTLKKALDESKDRVVILRGDEATQLGSAVKIMDAAKAAGAQKIAVATQPPSR